MPTPRTPLAKAALTGADRKDPQRYRDRAEPKTSGKAIGPAPKHLTVNARAVWQEMADSLGWLEAEDRTALELAAVSVGQIRDFLDANEPVTASLLSAANSAVGRLGASPVDRQRVMVKPDKLEDDTWAAFDVQPN